MEGYPAKTCETDRLVRQKSLVRAAIEGRKTQQRRNGVYAYPGERFQLEGVEFELIRLEREALSEMTEEDARAEGFESLGAYRDLILRMHQGMEWNSEALVWVHEFQKVVE